MLTVYGSSITSGRPQHGQFSTNTNKAAVSAISSSFATLVIYFHKICIYQPAQAQWCQTVTLQSVQGLTGLTHHF